MSIIWTRRSEVTGFAPGLELSVLVLDLQRLSRTTGQHRLLPQLERLARCAIRLAEDFADHRVRVAGGYHPAKTFDRHTGEARTRAIASLAWPRLEHATAHPECTLSVDQRTASRDGQMHNNNAVAVQATGGVLLEPQSRPAPVQGIPRFPHQRWVVRIDAVTLNLTRECKRQNVPA